VNKVQNALVGISACAALAFPAVALGHGGHGGSSHGPNQHANQHALRPHGHRHDRNTIVSGTVAAVTGNVVTVNVTGGNHAGRAFKGQAVQFDVSSARIVVADSNGDGKRNLSDVAVGDSVLVQAWLPRDGSGTQPFAARRLLDRGAPQSEGATDTETSSES
jgi:hypothetical protein